MSREISGNLITVAIPCYNSAKFVTSTLESVRKQEGSFDVLIRDDGSADKTVEVVDAYIAEHSLPWRFITGENLGSSLCRKALLDEVSTEFVFFIDSDDLLIGGDVIEKTSAFLDEYDIVYLNVTGNTKNRYSGDLIKDVYRGNVDGRINSVIKCGLLRDIEWHPFQYSEVNYYILAALLKCNKYIYIEEPLYRYRANRSGVVSSTDNMIKLLEERFYRNKMKELMISAANRAGINT